MKYQILIDGQPRRALTRKLIKLADGDTARYDKLCKAYDKDFQATGKLQECLVAELVDVRWRIEHLRIYSTRNRTLRGAPPTKARQEMEQYERRLMSQYDQLFTDLCRYQDEPKAA